MKRDHCDPRSDFEPRGQNAQTLFERAELVVHFHPQRLKSLGGRMTTAVTADNFFDRARQLKRFW